MEAFPLARYRFHSLVERELVLPEFAGSMLRGAFGHALKHSVCVTGLDDCRPCPLYRSCSYPAIFETPPPEDSRRVYSQIANPYVIEPLTSGACTLRVGSPFEFDMVLIGPALRQLPLIALAWQRALKGDLGKQHGSAHLRSVHSEDGFTVLEPGDARPRNHLREIQVPHIETDLREIILAFTTPLSLRREGRELDGATATPRDLLMALVRRTSDLANMQLGAELDVDYAKLSEAAGNIQGEANFEWQSWDRYSNRQQRAMRMGGLMGRWRLTGALEPFWPFLYLGQWLHVGKKCTFGLGGYRLVSPVDGKKFDG